MTCQEYFERVRNIVEVIQSLGGSLCDDMHLTDELPARAPQNGYTEEQYAEARKRITDKKVAYGILIRADRTRYGKLIEEIENDFIKGNKDYPKNPTDAYTLLVNYKHFLQPNKKQNNLDQVAFVATGKWSREDDESTSGEKRSQSYQMF
jgi:hypothetical protein